MANYTVGNLQLNITSKAMDIKKSLSDVSRGLKSVKKSVEDISIENLTKIEKTFSTISRSIFSLSAGINTLSNFKENVRNFTRGFTNLSETIDKIDNANLEKIKTTFTTLAESVKPFTEEIANVKEEIIALNGIVGNSSGIATIIKDKNKKERDEIKDEKERQKNYTLSSFASQYFPIAKKEDKPPVELSTTAQSASKFFNKTSDALSITKALSEKATEVGRNFSLAFTNSLGKVKSFNGVLKKTGAFLNRIGMIVTYRAIRAAMSAITKSVGDAMNEMAKYSNELNDALSEINSSAKVMSASIVQIIVPLIEIAAPYIRDISVWIAEFTNQVSKSIAVLKGQSTYLKINTDFLKDYRSALNSLTLSYDKFNSLGSGNDFSGLYAKENIGAEIGDGTDSGAELEREISSFVSGLMAVLIGVPLALGVILCMFGNFGAGIPLIAIGAAAIAAATDASINGYLTEEISNNLLKIESIVAISLLAIGALLIFFGNPVLGIGLIAGSAFVINRANATASEGNVSDEVKSKFYVLETIIGGSSLVIGTLLTIGGFYTLGIPLIAVGAYATGKGAANLIEQDGDITEEVKSTIAAISQIVGAASIVIGIILCVTGVGIPIGIGLIAAGLAATVTGIALKPTALLDMIKGWWDAIVDWWNNTALPGIKGVPIALANVFIFAFNGIADFFVGFVNGIIDIINILIKSAGMVASWFGAETENWGINKLDPDDFKFNYMEFAKGGLPDKGTMFLAGEAGAEVVYNGSNNQSGVANVDQLTQAFFNALVQANNAGVLGATDNGTVYIDGNKVGEIVASSKGFQSEGVRVGILNRR